MAFQAAKCPNCGGDLQLPTDRAAVKCMYCGGEIVVQQAIQAAGTGNIATWMQMGKAAASAGNNEEAVTYFNKALEVDPTNYEAWFLKGESTGWQGRLIDARLGEMISHINHAIDCAPDEQKPGLRLKAAESINTVAFAYYTMARDHMLEFVTVDGAWPEFLTRAQIALEALDVAHSCAPKYLPVMSNIAQIYANDISGVQYTGSYPDGTPRTMAHLVADEYAKMLTAKMQAKRLLFYLGRPKELMFCPKGQMILLSKSIVR